jgi:uncharacterized membrane protein (DUF2068 family)
MHARSGTIGLRAIAMFEAAKGLGVLLLGFGMLGLLHGNVEATAESLLVHLHVSPDRRVSHALVHAAAHMAAARLLGIVAGAVAYACVRFTEAWGLWHRRTWAQWLALLSGAIYLPWEFVELVRRLNWLDVIFFFGNLAILAYMSSSKLKRSARVEACVRELQAGGRLGWRSQWSGSCGCPSGRHSWSSASRSDDFVSPTMGPSRRLTVQHGFQQEIT